MVGFEVTEMLEQFERDLNIVEKAIEQSMANHNVLVGQKQTILHYIAKFKEGAEKVEEEVKTEEPGSAPVETVAE